MASLNPEHLEKYVQAVRPRFESTLRELVEIPTVSADPEHKKDILKGAQHAARMLADHGWKSELLSSKGNPIIFGRYLQNAAYPTVTIYNHMDVQPADGPDWIREPFRMTIEKDRYFGRGTTDDKGPALTVLAAANYAVKNSIPININFLWELEEEIGSPSFAECIKTHREKLTTDSVVVSDTIWVSRTKPAISAGLRGLQAMRLRLETGTKDVHSGLTGGLARNPIGELADVLAQCYDAETGKVKIPGFYKDVKPPTKKELSSFVESGFSLSGFKKDHELKSLRPLKLKKAVAAIWAMPTFEVHGIAGGYQGPGVKTIVPAWAEAKISMRLVPKMKAANILKLVQAYIKNLNADIKVIPEHGLEPFEGDTQSKYAQAAAQAIHFGFGKTPAVVREGGSIGAVLTMQKVLRCPVNFIGLSLPEHGYHAPNENYDWEQASGGIRTFVKYFELLSSTAK